MSTKPNYLKSPWATISFTTSICRGRLFAMYGAIIIGNVLSSSLPYFFKMIADQVVANPQTISFSTLSTPLFIIIGVLILHELSYRSGHIIEVYIATDMFKFITENLYEDLIARPTSYFENKFSGDLGRRIEQVGRTTDFLVEAFPWEVGWMVISIIMAGVLLGITHIYIFLTFLAWLIFFIATSTPLIRWLYRKSEAVATAHANLSGSIVDTLSNIALVHSSGGIPYEENRNRKATTQVLEAERSSRWVSVINKFHQGMSINLLVISLTLVSIFLFSRNELTLGGFVIVAAIIPSLIDVIWNSGNIVTKGAQQFGEFSDALNHLREYQEKLSGGKVERVKGGYDLTFKNISFAYPGTDELIFENFSLAVKAGEHVGIVGPSGTGKSTLIKLLLRQYEPQEGGILVGDTRLEEFSLRAFHDLIAYVPQDTSLFHRSLYENIHYARPTASKEEVYEASMRAHAHEFITALPQGYETAVGERGVKLSGGQRQRIALARAILKNAPFLILDEATSALDSESEAIVQEALGELFKDRTVIAIAHRLSTLRAMDRIIVMKEGVVVEQGAPQELLKTGSGIFQQMWEQQKNGFI